MEIVNAMILALFIFLLCLLGGGTLIGYYFAKKRDYEAGKIAAALKLMKGKVEKTVSGADHDGDHIG